MKTHFKEGDIVYSDDLILKWAETLMMFELLIENGLKLRPIKILIKHIIDKGYDKIFYPGTSLYNLLISIPINRKVNYNKTLRVECDQLREIVTFNYRDYSTVNRNSEGIEQALKWSESCQFTEVSDTFDYFVLLIKKWDDI